MNFQPCWEISGTHPLWVGLGNSGIHRHTVDFEQAEPTPQLLWSNPTYWLQNITNFISFWIFINNWSLCIFPWKILEKILEKNWLIFLSFWFFSHMLFFVSPLAVLSRNEPTVIPPLHHILCLIFLLNILIFSLK